MRQKKQALPEKILPIKMATENAILRGKMENVTAIVAVPVMVMEIAAVKDNRARADAATAISIAMADVQPLLPQLPNQQNNY